MKSAGTLEAALPIERSPWDASAVEYAATAIPYTAEDGYRWKAGCSCGWQSAEEYPSEEAALAVAERHVQANH